MLSIKYNNKIVFSPHSQKGHHQISTADLPANTQEILLLCLILNM
jgi:hypothetical protein